MSKEDLLEVRARVAQQGMELTPDEVEEIFKEVDPSVVVVDEPDWFQS